MVELLRGNRCLELFFILLRQIAILSGLAEQVDGPCLFAAFTRIGQSALDVFKLLCVSYKSCLSSLQFEELRLGSGEFGDSSFVSPGWFPVTIPNLHKFGTDTGDQLFSAVSTGQGADFLVETAVDRLSRGVCPFWLID